MASERSRDRTWVVSGVCCATEEVVLRKSFDRWLGSDAYAFNPITGELSVTPPVAEAELVDRLRQAGFDAKRKTVIVETEPFHRRHREAIVTATAAFLSAAGILWEHAGGIPVVARGLLLAAIVLGGWKVAVKAFKAVRLRSLDMNVLMTVAVGGALAIGKWDEAAAVIVLFALALMLESYSTTRSRKAIGSLMADAPAYASVVDGASERRIPAADVVPGATCIIRPGEQIPLDGVVVEGSSDVDESPITGEAVPQPKTAGTGVYAGTINRHGRLVVRVTARRDDSILARIVHLIEAAQERRAPVQRFVEKFAVVYTPAIFGLAALVAVGPPLLAGAPFGVWIYRALVLLVIGCPCALVISTPVTIVSALTGAARRGILIKGGRSIETLSGVRAIAFDKTGTLTEGHPRVTDVLPLDSLSREDALGIIAALERGSEHHLARALVNEAHHGPEGREIELVQFEALPGRGVRGAVNGTMYYLGNARLCEEQGYMSDDLGRLLHRLEDEGKTAMVLGTSGAALCVLAMRDSARGHARHVMERLRAVGIRHLVMVSGDRAGTAQRVAEEVGITEVESGLLPHEKVAAIERLKHSYGSVAMVGDGINDGPALAAANVGIAMGVAGTGVALESADVVLMSDDLTRLPALIGLSRKAMRVIRQNIAIALALKLVFLVLSCTGAATLWMALLADDGAALVVILNGLRALSHTDLP